LKILRSRVAEVRIAGWCVDEDVRCFIRGNKFYAHGCGFQVVYVRDRVRLRKLIYARLIDTISTIHGLMLHIADGLYSYYLLTGSYRERLGELLVRECITRRRFIKAVIDLDKEQRRCYPGFSRRGLWLLYHPEEGGGRIYFSWTPKNTHYLLDYTHYSVDTMLPISYELDPPATLSIKPPVSKGVYIGYVLDTHSFQPITRYYLPVDPMHTLIVGATGSGKSTTLKAIALGYHRETSVKIVVLDWHGEHYLEGFTKVEPVNAKAPILGLEPKQLIPLLDNIVYTIWGQQLTPLMTRILYRVIGGTSRKAQEILGRIKEIADNSKREDIALSASALYNRLYPIKDALEAMEPHGHTITSYLGKTPLVIDLSKMDPWSKIAYSHAVIAYLYNHLKRTRYNKQTQGNDTS